MADNLVDLEAALESMLADDETVSARAVIRRMAGALKHASDITRNVRRNALVIEYAKRQAKIRAAVERSSKRSSAELERLVAEKNAEIERLQGEKELLIASHRAMLLATAELGGFSAWKRFFDRYQVAIDVLEGMAALPAAAIQPFPARPRSQS